MKIYSKDVVKTSLLKTITLYILAILIIGIGVFSKSIYAYVVAGLVIAANIMQKEKYISEEGIVDSYQIFMLNHKNITDFSEIKEIDYEIHKQKKEIALHIIKEVMIKRFICAEEDFENIKKIICSARPDITFTEVKRGQK